MSWRSWSPSFQFSFTPESNHPIMYRDAYPVITMPDFLVEFFGRIAVMLPVILILVAVLWLIFNRRRHDTIAPSFSPSDMRTWSLRFALFDGAVFAVTFALLSAWMADSQFSAGVAGGLAALVAMGLVPWLATRYAKLSNK
jgi:ABC-type uncharacterized transport system permease subunit